jgi:NADH-quinone oxidoreductase subunit E
MRLDHLRGTEASRRRLEAQVWEGARVDADPATVPELHEVDVSPELKAVIEREMAKYPEFHSAVLPALRAAQEEHGWLSPEAMLEVAAVMRVTPAYLESIASFYDMFELGPSGTHTIYVCTNISCTLRGAEELLDAFSQATGCQVNGSSPDGEFCLRSFECLGACDIAPMASIEGYYRGPLTHADARAITDQLRAGRPPRELLPEKSYGGDYARRLTEREAAERGDEQPPPTGTGKEGAPG